MRRNLILVATMLWATTSCYSKTETTDLDKIYAFPGKPSNQFSVRQSKLKFFFGQETSQTLDKLFCSSDFSLKLAQYVRTLLQTVVTSTLTVSRPGLYRMGIVSNTIRIQKA